MKKNNLFSVVFAVIMCFSLLLGCGNQGNDSTMATQQPSHITEDLESSNEEVTPKEFYEQYLDACKISYTEAVDFVYFGNDWEADFYVSNPTDKLLEYEILEEKEINKNLFVFQVKFESASDQALGKITTAYNFVGMIDGEYKTITNARNVPDSLRDNFYEDEYQYTDGDNEVSPDEVMKDF